MKNNERMFQTVKFIEKKEFFSMVKFKKKYELPIFLVRERINNPPQTSKLTLSNFCPHFFFAFYLLFWSPPVFSNILRSKSYIKCFWWSCFFSFLYNHLKYTMLNYYKKKLFNFWGGSVLLARYFVYYIFLVERSPPYSIPITITVVGDYN